MSVDVLVCECLYELVFCSPCLHVLLWLCIFVCRHFLLSASRLLWPLHTPQAVSTAVELLKSGPACSDSSCTHTGWRQRSLSLSLTLTILACHPYFYSLSLFVQGYCHALFSPSINGNEYSFLSTCLSDLLSLSH